MSTKPLKPKSAPASTPAKVPNISALARELGVSRESLRKWKLEGVDLSDQKQLAARVERMHGGPATGDMASVRLRKLTAEASLRELELAKLRGELIAVGDVEESFAQISSAVRMALLRLVADLPTAVEGLTAAKSQPIIKSYILKAMAELHAAEFNNNSEL